MTHALSLEPPDPLQYFATLVADDASLPLLEAAASIALAADPAVDVQGVLDEVDALAATLVRRLPADAGPLQRLRLLNRYFFAELGFDGDVDDYHDPRNSDLSQVLARRRGIPITLALLYLELAAQAGLKAAGVSFPGHFLVKLRLPQGEVVIDPFGGQSLSREQLEGRLDSLRHDQGLPGHDELPLGLYLQAATPREILARMLRNLEAIHRGRDDARALLAVQERLVILLPDEPGPRRDRGLTLAALGCLDRACADVESYLAQVRRAPDALSLRRQLARWRAPPPPALH